VLVRLEDLENRARAACLDFGGTLSPESLRMLCCDAAVVPIVLDGKGQPLDVGRATRTIPDGLRRAVAARDGGCARCGRPGSWCEVHHVIPWEPGGETSLADCVMVCRACHRLIHHAGWDVRLVEGRPEFYPPPWIDPQRRARLRPPRLTRGFADHHVRPARGRAVPRRRARSGNGARPSPV
jgi:5-methylcytosine-specific restriction protein A